MRLSYARAAALALVVSLYAFAPPAADRLSEQDVKAIRALVVEQLPQRVAAHDWDGMAKLFAEDVVWMPAGLPTERGRDGMMDWMRRNWDPLPIKRFDQKVDKIDGRDDLAYARGTYSLTVELQAETRIHDKGKFLVILEKEKDTWRVSSIMYSRDTDKPQVGD